MEGKKEEGKKSSVRNEELKKVKDEKQMKGRKQIRRAWKARYGLKSQMKRKERKEKNKKKSARKRGLVMKKEERKKKCRYGMQNMEVEINIKEKKDEENKGREKRIWEARNK